LFVAILAFGQSKEKPGLVSSPLSTDELEVYRALLNLLNSTPKTQVKNLVNQTSPFDISEVPEGTPCLQGIEFEKLSHGSRTVHSFGAEITDGMALKLVEPTEETKIILREKDSASPKQKRPGGSAEAFSESGLLVVSEITFDKKHQFAGLKYVFFCGSHCKYEMTRVLEKVGGVWTTPVRRVCAVSLN
jgi:hypothetical protein